MSIEAFYTNTFTPYTITESATWPHDKVETAGTAFNGALDQIGSNEKWADAEIVAVSTHWIACASSVAVTRGQRIKLGARSFEVTGVPDPCGLKAGHHQEIYVKEIT